MAANEMPECLDFLHFQDLLQKMRMADDKIIYTMNTLPTESFKDQKDCNATCKEIFEQLQSRYNQREKTIKKCLEFTTERINELKNKREKDSNDESVVRNLRKEKGKWRLLQKELGVEEVVRDKTNKIYYEKCRQFYIPPNLNL